jgi:hypothetical protein
MSDPAVERAQREFSFLQQRIGGGGILRADVQAQFLRLSIFHNQPFSMVELERLFDLQHESGGFHFRSVKGTLSADLSVHATMFAIQALALSKDRRYVDSAGPLKRRELSIV